MNTKMTLRQNKQFVSRKNIALIALVAISAFALLYTPLRATLTQAVYKVAPSIFGVGGNAESAWGEFLTNFREKDALVKENEILNEAISIMETKVLDRNLLAEKVTRLEEALGRVRSDDRVVANVLVGAGQSPYDTLVIDVGEEEGVNTGNMVVYSGSGAIGEVVETSSYSAKIKLYSSPGEEHRVTVGSHYIPVLAVGRGMGNFEAKVPQDSAVSVGDYVVTVKGNLVLGTVSSIEAKPAEPIKRIFFRVPFNITEIRSVEVIVDKQQ